MTQQQKRLNAQQLNHPTIEPLSFNHLIDVVKGRSNNSEKQPPFGDQFFRPESSKKRAWSSYFSDTASDDLFKQIL